MYIGVPPDVDVAQLSGEAASCEQLRETELLLFKCGMFLCIVVLLLVRLIFRVSTKEQLCRFMLTLFADFVVLIFMVTHITGAAITSITVFIRPSTTQILLGGWWGQEITPIEHTSAKFCDSIPPTTEVGYGCLDVSILPRAVFRKVRVSMIKTDLYVAALYQLEIKIHIVAIVFCAGLLYVVSRQSDMHMIFLPKLLLMVVVMVAEYISIRLVLEGGWVYMTAYEVGAYLDMIMGYLGVYIMSV